MGAAGRSTQHTASQSVLVLPETIPRLICIFVFPKGPRGRDLLQGPRGRELPQGPRGARRDSKTGVMQYMEAALRGPDGNL